ncbi:MAG: GntR family transcriptional regulator, partial [Solirubrobacteraceae bacterium]
ASLAQTLTEAFDARLVSAGDRLAPERELADAYGSSRSTGRQALASLERQGRILRAVGRGGGTFVCERKLDRDLSEFRGVSDHFQQQGVAVRAELISATQRPARPGLAAALEIAPGDPIYEIVRVRHAHDKPVALERSCFTAAHFPELLTHDLSERIYPLMRSEYGLAPECAREYLEALPAESDEATVLQIPQGTPVMYVERIGYTLAGQPLEFSREFFRGDRTRVVIWTPYRGTDPGF